MSQASLEQMIEQYILREKAAYRFALKKYAAKHNIDEIDFDEVTEMRDKIINQVASEVLIERALKQNEE